MKLNIQKGILENALVRSQSFLSKDTSDITSQILLSAKGGTLSIQATDYGTGIVSTVDELLIIDDGDVIVSGIKLLSSIKALKSGEINIESKGGILTISQSRSKFKLPIFDSAIFPQFPQSDNLSELTINSISMIDSFKKVLPSIDTNNPKFELTGAIMSISSDRVEFASTDTKRLHVATLETKSDNEVSLIIPKKAIVEMQKLFFDDVEMLYNDDILIIKSSNTQFFTKLINGKFPDYKRIIPTETMHNVDLHKLDLLDCIKQVSTISSEIKISFKSDIIEIESLTDDKNQARTAIETETEIEDITICVQSQYITDFLNSIVENDFTIKMNENNMPFVLECDNLKAVIMPIVL